MVLDLLTILLGLAGLFIGGEFLIRSSSRLATAFGIPTLIVGLTIVALGTSAPELVVAVVAALGGSSDIAIGNIVGSNIANIGLILGIAGLITPLRIDSRLIRREIPTMIGISVVVFLMATDGEIGRLEGVFLVAGYVLFTFLLYKTAPKTPAEVDKLAATIKKDDPMPTNVAEGDLGDIKVVAEVEQIEGGKAEIKQINRQREMGMLIFSMIVLAVGAQLTVNGATNIARVIGISEIVIGLTLVAVGTSLPEITTSTMAALRKHDDLAAGNVVGSNISNLLVILGITALINPIAVDPGLLQFEFPVMLAFATVPLAFVLNRRLERREAGILLAAYIGFIVLTLVTG